MNLFRGFWVERCSCPLWGHEPKVTARPLWGHEPKVTAHLFRPLWGHEPKVTAHQFSHGGYQLVT